MLATSKKYSAFLGYSLLWFSAPLVLYANGLPKDATELLNRISTYIINPIIFLLFTAVFVVFIWGLVQFVSNLDNEEARSTGGKHMLYGIIGMVIMVGVNAIIAIIQNTIAQIGG